jgi:hypothetical protein
MRTYKRIFILLVALAVLAGIPLPAVAQQATPAINKVPAEVPPEIGRLEVFVCHDENEDSVCQADEEPLPDVMAWVVHQTIEGYDGWCVTDSAGFCSFGDAEAGLHLAFVNEVGPDGQQRVAFPVEVEVLPGETASVILPVEVSVLPDPRMLVYLPYTVNR